MRLMAENGGCRGAHPAQGEAESCLARGNRGKRIYKRSQDPEIDISFRSFFGFPHFSVLHLLKRKSRMRVILTVT